MTSRGKVEPARNKLGQFKVRTKSPFDAGWDSVINGADMDNCHFFWFTSAERTKEWEMGVKAAKKYLTPPKQEVEHDHRR
jgi:hypothetical protein